MSVFIFSDRCQCCVTLAISSIYIALQIPTLFAASYSFAACSKHSLFRHETNANEAPCSFILRSDGPMQRMGCFLNVCVHETGAFLYQVYERTRGYGAGKVQQQTHQESRIIGYKRWCSTLKIPLAFGAFDCDVVLVARVRPS